MVTLSRVTKYSYCIFEFILMVYLFSFLTLVYVSKLARAILTHPYRVNSSPVHQMLGRDPDWA